MQSAPALRPLSVADLVDEIFRLYRRNFGLLFGLAALIWLPASILLVAGFSLIGRFGGAAIVSAGIVVLAVAGIVALVTFPLLLGAVTHAIAKVYLGRATTIGEAFRRAVTGFWRLIFGFLIVGVAVIGTALAIGFGGTLVAVGIGGVAAIAIAVVAIVGLVLAAVWIAVTWAFFAQVVIIEDSGIGASLRRSAHLVNGSRWRVIGINLLLGIISGVLVSIPAGLAAVVFTVLPIPETIAFALGQLVSAFAQTAFYPVQLGTMTLLYFDLRVRREGFDLTLAAEALPPS